jgi:hypothetical protein
MALHLIKLMLLLGVTGLVSAPAAHAVVYCKTVGVPKGCVARPGAAGVGVTPGVGVGAPGVGVAPANRGGPVNRAGVR